MKMRRNRQCSREGDQERFRKAIAVEKGSFGPFFILAVVYIVCMILGYIITDFFLVRGHLCWHRRLPSPSLYTSALDSALALFVPVALVIVITLSSPPSSPAPAPSASKESSVSLGIGMMVVVGRYHVLRDASPKSPTNGEPRALVGRGFSFYI